MTDDMLMLELSEPDHVELAFLLDRCARILLSLPSGSGVTRVELPVRLQHALARKLRFSTPKKRSCACHGSHHSPAHGGASMGGRARFVQCVQEWMNGMLAHGITDWPKEATRPHDPKSFGDILQVAAVKAEVCAAREVWKENPWSLARKTGINRNILALISHAYGEHDIAWLKETVSALDESDFDSVALGQLLRRT